MNPSGRRIARHRAWVRARQRQPLDRAARQEPRPAPPRGRGQPLAAATAVTLLSGQALAFVKEDFRMFTPRNLHAWLKTGSDCRLRMAGLSQVSWGGL